MGKPRDVAVQLRVPAIDDFNCGYNEGVGYLHVNQKRGRRWSSAGGFLKLRLRAATCGARATC